jgi:hypothetical protein
MLIALPIKLKKTEGGKNRNATENKIIAKFAYQNSDREDLVLKSKVLK